MARLYDLGPKLWSNLHQSTGGMTNHLFTIYNDSVGTLLTRYNDTGQTLSDLLGKIKTDPNYPKRIRMCGGKWSISGIAYDRVAILESDHLTLRWQLNPQDLASTNIQQSTNYLFTQCGSKIKSLNIYLRDRKKSIKTSGASNGQTIAGAISTGTHGSAIDFGAIHDSVAGLHIIVGPGKSYYIQKASKRIVNQNFAQSINSTLIEDDDLFNAAVVSMGCFGLIYGVLLETEDWFLLKNYTKKLPAQDAGLLMKTLNFTPDITSRLQLPAERPFHFKLLVNPYNSSNPKMEVMYKRQGPATYVRPPVGDDSTYPKDALGWVAVISQNLPGSDRLIVNLLESKIFPKDVDGAEALLYDTFSDTSLHGKTFSCAIGIPLELAEKALNLLIHEINQHGSIPGIFALRYVKGSDALMAFTKFSTTCILELDAVRNAKVLNFVRKIPGIFEIENIPFTFHWGKDHPADADMVKSMYGSNYKKWVDQKKKIMDSAEAALFISDHADEMGLGLYDSTLIV